MRFALMNKINFIKSYGDRHHRGFTRIGYRLPRSRICSGHDVRLLIIYLLFTVESDIIIYPYEPVQLIACVFRSEHECICTRRNKMRAESYFCIEILRDDVHSL